MEITLELNTEPIDFLAWTVKQSNNTLSIFIKNKGMQKNTITQIEITSMLDFASINNLRFNSIIVDDELIRFLFFIRWLDS